MRAQEQAPVRALEPGLARVPEPGPGLARVPEPGQSWGKER